MTDLAAAGIGPGEVLGIIAASLGLAAPAEQVTPVGLATVRPRSLPRAPWIVRAAGPQLRR